MNFQEATAAWRADRNQHRVRGVDLPDVVAYMPEEFKRNFNLAMDTLPQTLTQPALTTVQNSAVPAFLTTMIDPAIFKILFAPNRAAVIMGEVRKGTWLDETAMFPTVEHTGEVSSYSDYAENGRAGVNTNWPQRQAYLFQTIKEYGDRELERAGLARINWVSEIDVAAATILNKYSNLIFGKFFLSRSNTFTLKVFVAVRATSDCGDMARTNFESASTNPWVWFTIW